MEIIPIIILMVIVKYQVSFSEVQRNRYVLREHRSFEIICKHKLGKVTRVTWEYISTHDNVNRTIYDSQQPNNPLKSGFEVSCQLHEAFISTCILKLVQARKEDSGKYICYVGEENKANLDSNLLKPVTEVELVVRGPKYETIVVNKDDSIILPCEHNKTNLTRARWSHYSIHGVRTYAVYHLPAKETSNKNYEALCEPHQLSCNLKILQANKESAGRYICMVGESLEFEEKYGLDQMTYFIEMQLVVGELECNENMNKDLTLIGENDCHGIEADVLNLKCSFNYFGNINYNLLHLSWIEKHKFNSLEKKLNSSLIKHEVKDETNKISIQTNLSVAYEMQNSIFQCVFDDTAVKPCQLNEFRTQYAKNTTQRSPPINSDELQNKICLANKSANVQCSYYWVHETPGAMAENPHALLPFENMRSLGIYTCFAKCDVGNHKECIIRATEFEIIHGSHKLGLIIGLIIGIIVVAVTFGGICFVLRKKKLLFRRKNRKEQIKTVEGEEQQEAKGLLGKHTSQKTDDKVDADGGESSTLSHGKQQDKNRTKEDEIIRLSPAPRNPFEVKKILHEKKTDHHEIKIYEAMDTDFGKVLMIDGAVWDAELSKFSYQKMMNVLPIKSHPNPRKVLVIGGGEVRTVKELVKNPEVESITVCEVDEELLAMCRNYAPSLTSSLDDPKVKIHIGDGFEFLKSTKEAFDVIINHSSHLQGPSEYLFTKEYYEVVKSKLKEGGVTSSIVNRKDASGSDVIESRVMNFCKELFPVVKYFYIPAFNHPSSLIRCLICSLNPATNFRILFHKLNTEYGFSGAEEREKRKMDKEKRNKKKENGEEDTDDDDDKKEQLRKKLNPRANEFLKNIASGQTITDHENERNFRNRRVYSAMEKGYKLLMVKKVLYEEKSEHHDIKIYESTKNGKVLMLDGAIWATEFDSMNQKALISTLLISHEEPKDVLVIGGGDGAIVKKLLNHQTVESITVYEVDEEIIKLGHQYFPSLTSSLEDPKVKVNIGDGNEFVKKQENAFDVIIIRSTNVQDDYLDKEYFEVIEKALKKEGVVSFFVDGKGTRDDDDDIMSSVMILCEQIFPVVHYFVLPFHEHPGTLTRCLMCSLNPKNDFCCAFEMVNEEVGKSNWYRGLWKKLKWS